MLDHEIYQAWLDFRKGKKPSLAIDTFGYSLQTNLLQLASDIDRRTYRHGGYKNVIVYEKKCRDLAVAEVRDRILHRYIYNYLTQLFDKTFDLDVWS